jgi:putative membrane protein
MENQTRQPRTPREYLSLFLTGLGMGAADTVPGVSGGTVAFVRGIYSDLLNAIKSFNLDLLKKVLKLDVKGVLEHVPWRFLITLGSGILLAIFSLARLVSWLLENQRVLLFAFFFGLVVASAIAVAGKLKQWSPLNIVWLIVGGVAAFVIVGLVPSELPHDPLTLFFSGFVAIMAMILPGISGSSILLILGQYEYILNAVRDFNLGPVIILGSGCVVGIAIFSRILSWFLQKYEQSTIALLIGFVVGSLRAVWPWQVENTVVVEGITEVYNTAIMPVFTSGEFWLAIVIALVGFIIVSLIDHMESWDNPVLRLFWRRTPAQVPAPSGD